MIYLYIKFHMANSYDSLVIAIKVKAEYRLIVATTLFYIL